MTKGPNKRPKKPQGIYPTPRNRLQVTPFTRENTAIIAGHQTPVIRYAGNGIWHIWLAYNNTFTAGTYMRLVPDGRIFSDTLQPDGSLSTGVIKHTRDEPDFFSKLARARKER